VSWTSVNLADNDVVRSLTTVRDGLVPIVDTMKTVTTTVKTLADLVVNLLVFAADPVTATLQAAIDAVRGALKDLQESAGCYYLAVPIRGITETTAAAINYALEPTDPRFPAGLLPPANGMSGGNYGFLRDVQDSLADELDVLRPQFTSEAYVAGVVIVAGSDNYLRLLELVDKLKALLSGAALSGPGEGLVDVGYPKPRGLRATLVPSAVTGSDRLANRLTSTVLQPYSVKLEWPRANRTIARVDLGEPAITYTIKRIGVYRRTEASFPINARDVEANPYGLYTPIVTFEYDGWTNFAYDDTVLPGNTYYYGVGYEIEAARGTETVTYPFGPFATTSIVLPTDIAILPRTGVPPDWLMLPSPLSLIPAIANFVTAINRQLDNLEERLASAQDQYQKYIDALQVEIDRYARFAQDINQAIEQLVELMTFPDVYIGAYPFAGKGGNTFFINALGKALTDTADPNRPPFDNGDAIVTGFVLYTGAETPGRLEKLTDLISMLFGSTSTSASSAYAQASASLEGAVREIDRQITFLQNLDRDPNPSTQEATPVGIGRELTPATEQYEPKRESVP